MVRLGVVLCVVVLASLTLPRTAAAGGNEFPGGGTRALGRGGTGFTRADDPTVMLRNPALLADMWDDQAIAGANFLLVDSCFKATGGYGLGASGIDWVKFSDDPKDSYLVQRPPGSTDLEGNPLRTFLGEPYPEVCYSGPMPVLPSVALSMKLSSDLGVGIGFFPPDTTALNQWGNRDGTVNTPKGLRPSPTRYFRSHLNTSYFSVLGAVGYRLSDFIRIGGGFQWNVVAFEATNWARPTPDLAIRNDVRIDTFGRDLFIPGLIGSVHIVPHENLDIALGFKWSDQIKTKAKLDLTTGAFGTGEPFFYIENGVMKSKSGTVPHTTHNQRGSVSAPPIWAPQLTFGARYADRLKPRVMSKDWDEAHFAADRRVEDSMATERWDVEVNGVLVLNSVNDEQVFTTEGGVNAAKVVLVEKQAPTPAQPNGAIIEIPSYIGTCTNYDKASSKCLGQWRVPTHLGGKTQLSLRAGGDYNLLPGLFALRAGVSYETDGADVEYLDITNYMLGRLGLHAGATLRVADRTDLSVAFAHFFQPDVRLDPNNPLPPTYQTAAYNYVPGSHDGVGRLEVPYGDRTSDLEGPYYANVGSYHYKLSVVSITLAQHF